MSNLQGITGLPHAPAGAGQASASLDRLDDVPIMYEDENEGDTGDSNVHTVTNEVLHICALAHFEENPSLQVFANMNLYYRQGPEHKRTKSPPLYFAGCHDCFPL